MEEREDDERFELLRIVTDRVLNTFNFKLMGFHLLTLIRGIIN